MKELNEEIREDFLKGLYMAVGYWRHIGPERDTSWMELNDYVREMLKKYDSVLYDKVWDD